MAKEKPIEDVLSDFPEELIKGKGYVNGPIMPELPKAIPESKPERKRRCLPAKVQIMLQLKKWTLDFYTEMARKEDESRNRSICKVLEEYARYEMEQKT